MAVSCQQIRGADQPGRAGPNVGGGVRAHLDGRTGLCNVFNGGRLRKHHTLLHALEAKKGCRSRRHSRDVPVAGRSRIRSQHVRMRISARNQLAGNVVSLDLGAVMATVVIRLGGGEEVVAAITKDSAARLELAEGDAVTAVIKATEVMVAKE